MNFHGKFTQYLKTMSKPIYLKSDKKVLIVEDDPGILMALEFLIANEGYQYDKAENGIEAIQK